MNKPEIYKKDQKYNIIYADKDGKDNEFKFTPKEDMSKPEMIMKCKEANKNFVKLKEIKKLEEGVHRMKKRYKDFKKIKKEANNKFLNLAQYFWDECSEYFENAYYKNDSYEEFNEELSNDGTLMEEFAEQNIVSDKDIDKLIKEIYEMAQELLEKNKEMIQEALEENNEINTLADIIKDRYKKGLEGLDVGDNTIDMIVYFDYNPEDVTNSADTYSKCLDTIATGTKVVNYDEEGAYAVVDFYNYVIDHLNAFTSNFTINIDPADGEDNETIAANIVEGILPGLFSGYTDDHTYNSLDTDLLMGVQKKEEKKEQYTLDNIDDAIHEIRSKIAKQRAYDRRRDAVCLSIGDDDAVYKPMYDELKRLNAIKKDLQSNKEIKEESFEDSKKFMAGEILAIIDRYIHTSDLENLFKDMDIDQSIYEGDKDIPDGKIQDIVEIGLQWLFDHLQPEDYKRVLKNDLEMTDEEMEKYGVELEESKKIEEDNENSFKPEVNNIYFLDNNLIWDQRIGDLAIGIGASQLESIKEAEDQSGVTVDENIKKYLEEHPANLFIVEGQLPNIKVTLLGDQSGNPVKIDNLRVNG